MHCIKIAADLRVYTIYYTICYIWHIYYIYAIIYIAAVCCCCCCWDNSLLVLAIVVFNRFHWKEFDARSHYIWYISGIYLDILFGYILLVSSLYMVHCCCCCINNHIVVNMRVYIFVNLWIVYNILQFKCIYNCFKSFCISNIWIYKLISLRYISYLFLTPSSRLPLLLLGYVFFFFIFL